MSRGLFVYGVLIFPEVRDLLGIRISSIAPAVLPGYGRRTLREEGGCAVPAVFPKRGDSTDGLLLHGLDRRSRQVLDRFEEVDQGTYWRRRVAVHSSGRLRTADIYLPVSSCPGFSGPVWCPALFRDRYLQRYLQVVVRPFAVRR